MRKGCLLANKIVSYPNESQGLNLRQDSPSVLGCMSARFYTIFLKFSNYLITRCILGDRKQEYQERFIAFRLNAFQVMTGSVDDEVRVQYE